LLVVYADRRQLPFLEFHRLNQRAIFRRGGNYAAHLGQTLAATWFIESVAQSLCDSSQELPRRFKTEASKMDPPPNDGICAIFVHAGAGFHNFENEHKHLGACDSYVFLVHFHLVAKI
jgi:AraC-like DNA-binding protein